MSRRRIISLIVAPLIAVAMMGAEDPGCGEKNKPGAHGGRPAPAKQQPAPKADPNPKRTDQVQKTYLFRIEVQQFYPHYIYVSHQIGSVRDLEEETNDRTWWTEARLVPGDKLWIHVTKPRGQGITTCKIFYIPDNRSLRWKERRSRTIVGAGSCDAVYYVTHREESDG